MSQQIQISGGAKVRNLEGVIVGSSGVVSSLGINVPSGIPQLDGSGKILVSQLPNSVMEFKGNWNVSTNTPTLVNGTGNAGDVYLVEGAAVGGTSHDFGAGPITFYNGDQAIYSGSIWQRASGATGTVTSVALTETGDSLNITGSPITTSGTINIGFNGNSGQYINGAGNLTTFPSLTGYVPYTGATTNVDLGTFGLLADYLKLNVLPTSIPTTESTMAWNDTDGTMDIKLKGGNVTLQVGQEQVVRIVNKSGASLLESEYKVVRIRSVAEGGAQGQRLAVVLAQGDTAAHSKGVLGLVTETIADNQEGFITILGQVHEIDTTGTLQGETWVDGDKLYLSATTAGKLTKVAPVAPNHSVVVGYVEYAHAVHGKIFVSVNEGLSLDELHNVYAPSPTNNQSIWWNAANSRYENNTIAGILGYTPANASTTISTTAPLSGGGDLSANRTLSISQATTSTNGYLSSTDWNTFNNKQNAIGYTPANDALVVHLSGAETITGIKTFSNEALFGNGITLTGGYITYTSGIYNLTLNTNVLTANRNIFLKDGSGTLAFTSDIPSLSGYVQGSGTTNYLPKFTGTSTIGNSIIQESSGNIGINQAPASIFTLDVKSTSGTLGFQIRETAGNNAVYIYPNASGFNRITSNYNTSAPYLPLALTARESNSDLVLWADGNTSIGQSSNAGYKLDVNGTGRFSGAVAIRYDEGTSADAQLRLRGTNATARTTRIQLEDYAGIYADALIDFKINTAGVASSATLSIGVNSAGLTFNNTNAATFSSSVTASVFNTSSTSGYLLRDADVAGYGIYKGSSTRIGIAANGNEVLSVTSGGLVGIGTTSPIEKLTSNGLVAITGASVTSWYVGNNNAAFVDYNSGDMRIGSQSSAGSTTIQFYTTSSGYTGIIERMRIFSDGNLGLNTTTNAGYKLDVNGTGRFSSNLYTSTALYIATTAAYGFKINSEGSNGFYNRGGSTTAHYPLLLENASGALLFQVQGNGAATFSSSVTATGNVTGNGVTIGASDVRSSSNVLTLGGTSEVIRIVGSSGNVGIGTSSPYNKLTIEGSSARMDLNDGGGASRKALLLEPLGYGSNAYARIESYNYGTATGGNLVLNATGGNVGIGTTSPISYSNKTTLAVQGAWGGQLDIMVGSTSHAQFGTDNYSSGLSARIQSADGIVFKTNGGTPSVIIAANGNLLVNNSTDAGYKLDVNGTVRGTAFFESSSIKGKDIIATNPLLALDIDVIKYTRKNDESKDIRYGYSAEQIHSLMPELTDKDVSAVKYLDVHTILIANLQKEIKELKAKLN